MSSLCDRFSSQTATPKASHTVAGLLGGLAGVALRPVLGRNLDLETDVWKFSMWLKLHNPLHQNPAYSRPHLSRWLGFFLQVQFFFTHHPSHLRLSWLPTELQADEASETCRLLAWRKMVHCNSLLLHSIQHCRS